ncbi:MAG: NAD(P)H-dependent oxidoreductase subunit E [Alphaproteobacteria bacterium]|nr:NAD(P)H-dependent oxidoreductase subunit E [Alphaproteobacteria bacterium]
MSNAFKFSAENQKKIKQILERYPKDHPQSAVMPLLDLAQAQNGGWLSCGAIEVIAELLQMPVIRVQEVATFYTMYRLQPVGKTVIQVCTTTPCWLRGSDDVMKMCKSKLGLQPGEMNNDISLFEVQCLGACVNAPIVQINDAYIEDVNPEVFSVMLDDVIAGKPIKTGSMLGRICSEPMKGSAS